MSIGSWFKSMVVWIINISQMFEKIVKLIKINYEYLITYNECNYKTYLSIRHAHSWEQIQLNSALIGVNYEQVLLPTIFLHS